MSQWDQVSEQFARLSLAADEAPIGMERVRAHEMALRLAQANQSFAEEFVARIDLTQALYYVPDDPHTLVHFTWLRRALDPVHELEEDDRHAVLWRLKWAIDLIETLPEVPLSALVAALDKSASSRWRSASYSASVSIDGRSPGSSCPVPSPHIAPLRAPQR